MAYLKKDAPDKVVETLDRIEGRADECWRPLRILRVPANLAVWALLTGGIQIVEREQAALRSSNTFHLTAALQNLGRLLAIAVKWSFRRAQPSAARLPTDWSHELNAAVDQALEVAEEYSHFEVCFQSFHKNRNSANLLGTDLVRFTAPGVARDRQVSAYQKGFVRVTGALLLNPLIRNPRQCMYDRNSSGYWPIAFRLAREALHMGSRGNSGAHCCPITGIG